MSGQSCWLCLQDLVLYGYGPILRWEPDLAKGVKGTKYLHQKCVDALPRRSYERLMQGRLADGTP